MDVLKDIAYILDRYQVRYIEVLTNPQAAALSPAKARNESRYHEFYTGLRDDTWPSEKAAAAHFGMAPGDHRFKKLKQETLKRLVNSVLFTGIDTPDKLSFDYILQEITRLQAVLHTLGRRMAKTAFFSLAEYTLKRAEDIEHIGIIVEVLKMMKSIAAHHAEYRKHYDNYKLRLDYYWEAYVAETQVRDAYEDFITPLTHSKGIHKATADKARDVYQSLAHLGIKYPHHHLNYYLCLLEYYACIYDGDWSGALQPLHRMNALLKTKRIVPHNTAVLLHNMTAYALMMQQRFDDALDTLDQALAYAHEGAPGWFKIHELSAACALYAGQFGKAVQEINRCYTHKRFHNINRFDQDSWRIFGSYLYLLDVSGKVQGLAPAEQELLKRFKIAKTLNETHIYSLDKRGGNIPRLVLNIITLLIDLKMGKDDIRRCTQEERLIQSLEALRKYCLRNLNIQEYKERTECFLRMLSLLPRYYHAPLKLKEKSMRYVHKMAMITRQESRASFEIEILSYEYQWQWILEILVAGQRKVQLADFQTDASRQHSAWAV